MGSVVCGHLEGGDGALAAAVAQHPIEVQRVQVPHRPRELRIPQPTTKAMPGDAAAMSIRSQKLGPQLARRGS